MIIDVAFLIVIFLAIFKGLSKGLILGLFSLIAFIIGLAAALKLSVAVAAYLKSSAGSFTKWLPVISFLLVFIAVALLINICARIIKKILRFAMLGWADSLGGMIFYIIIYCTIFSIFLFFGEKLFLIQSSTIESSKIYPYISGWGPKVMNNIGNIIPIFKNMFAQLQDFFETIAKKTA
jgi:membrane protein required for colicin V production